MHASTAGNWGRVRQEHEVVRFFDGLDVIARPAL